MTQNNKENYNPIPLGTLYFGFALSLFLSDQIDNPQIKYIAIFILAISFVFFVAVFSEHVLIVLSKYVVKWLAFLTFLAFLYGFYDGWLKKEVEGKFINIGKFIKPSLVEPIFLIASDVIQITRERESNPRLAT